MKSAAAALLILSGCETTAGPADDVELPPVVDMAITDEQAPVVAREAPTPYTATPDVPFEGEGVGITPAGCRDLRERDPEANCR